MNDLTIKKERKGGERRSIDGDDDKNKEDDGEVR